MARACTVAGSFHVSSHPAEEEGFPESSSKCIQQAQVPLRQSNKVGAMREAGWHSLRCALPLVGWEGRFGGAF